MKVLRLIVVLLSTSFSFLFSGVMADVLTFHNDTNRYGANRDEIALTPLNVNTNSFGLRFTLPVDDKVYAQPLYVSSVPVGGQLPRHNLLIVATEHDVVYAFDADSGAQMWQTSLLGANEVWSDDRNCGDLTPDIGVTGTPVIDRGVLPYGRIYVVAMSKTAGSTTYFQRLHALDLATGQDVQAPVTIQASYPGSGPGNDGKGNVIFNPATQRQRAPLLLFNGTIYIGWASFCDHAPYTGWIMGYNENTLAQTAVLNVNPNGTPISTHLPDGSGNGIWGGAGLAERSGNIYVAIGNGPFDSNLDANGFPSDHDFGNTFLKLSPNLLVTDYFTPYNQAQLAASDSDQGSGGVMLLPDLTDANNIVRHLGVNGGKDGNLYLIDLDNPGKFIPGATSNSNVYQELLQAVRTGLYCAPAYFNTAIYCGPQKHALKRFKISHAQLIASSSTANTFGFPGTTPSISSFGTTNAIVWAYEDTTGTETGNPVLHAYDALNLASELYNSTQKPQDNFGSGTANKFITPTICNGKVYVGTATLVAAFGLLPPITTAADLSTNVQIAFQPPRFNSSTRQYTQSATLTNTSGGNLNLPVSLVFDNLSANAALANAFGATSSTSPSGSSYINFPLTSPLAPGQSVTAQLVWIDSDQPPTPPAISFTGVRVLAGPNSR